MTYHGAMPPGQGFNGQPPPMTQPDIYGQTESYNQQGDANFNPQYQDMRFLPPSQPQQHVQYYVDNRPQIQSYDGTFDPRVTMPRMQPMQQQQQQQQPVQQPLHYYQPQYSQEMNSPIPMYQAMPQAQYQTQEQPRPPAHPHAHPQYQAQAQPQAYTHLQPHAQYQTQPQIQPQAQPRPQPSPQTQAQSVALPTQQLQQPPPNAQRQPQLGSKPRDNELRQPSEDHRARSAIGKGHRPSSQGSAITKSPVVSNTQNKPLNTLSLLIHVAEDCFARAHERTKHVAASMDGSALAEHNKLIATGLGCLDAALQSNKLTPRMEARLRLRYAAILNEETENWMEIETVLTKGLPLCEKHRFTDLKNSMDYILLQSLFSHTPKAALVGTDIRINDCTTYKQVPWVYAFRFLKVSFYFRYGTFGDVHAIENLRRIGRIASSRSDSPICVLTSLLEGLTHLWTLKDDGVIRVQTCIAQAAKHQLEASVHIPQLDVLTLLLDIACSLHQKVGHIIIPKLKALQSRMDELIQSPEWENNNPVFLLPFKKQATPTALISTDTSAILRPGDGSHDYLVMSFMGKMEAFILGYAYSGLALLYKGHSTDKSFDLWQEAMKMLEAFVNSPRPSSLEKAIEDQRWRTEITVYINIVMALVSATHSNWPKVRECARKVNELEKQLGSVTLSLFALYLSGVYHQGTGDLDAALRVFEDPRLAVPKDENVPHGQSEVAYLAALNRLWIMQEPDRRDDEQATEILEQIRQPCLDHVDPDLRTAVCLAMATVHTNPEPSINQLKRHIQHGLAGSQLTNNHHCLSIALNIMRARLFENVVGEQAMKSAKAGSAQAKRSGNMLWMSVADGMLGQSQDLVGWVNQANSARAAATEYANKAFP